MTISTAAHILVADDSEIVQLTIVTILKNMGHSGVVVNNGRAALERLQQRHFDLVLLDVMMPGMDGLQALASLRSVERQQGNVRQKVIMVTGHAEPGDRERLRAAGADGYVAKPIQPHNFVQEIQRVLALTMPY